MASKRIAIAFALLATTSAHAIDIRPTFDLQSYGIYRTIAESGVSNVGSSATDGLLFFGTQVLVTNDSFEFEVRHELRTIFGTSPGLPEGDPARLDIESPPRFMQAERILVNSNGVESISDIERLRASYIFTSGDAWVGRRPISIGTLSFFKVWNKFTQPVAGLFGPTIVYGSDGFGLNYQAGSFAFKAFSLYGPTADLDAHLLETTIFNPFAEIRVLGGRWWDHAAIGLAMSKTVLDWMVRLETLYLNGEGSSETEMGLGLDGAINANVSLLLETYYQSNGATDTTNYTVTDPSVFTNLRARYYSFALLNWQLSTLWKMGVGDLLNGVDGGQIGILKFNYSLSDDIELLAEANVPFASDGAEFSSRAFVFEDGSFLGSGNQFSLGLKATF